MKAANYLSVPYMGHTGHAPHAAGQRGLLWATAILIVVALFLGGQGNGNALRELAIQLVALFAALMVIAAPAPTPDPVRRAARWVIAAMVGLIVLHLVPLPYNLWAAISPVDTARTILEGFGQARGWRPFSVVPHEALDNLFLLIAPVVTYFAVLRLDPVARARLVTVVVLMAAASVILGLMQYASGTDTLDFYTQTNRGYGVGVFSNRNHQADLAIIGWLLAAGLLANRHLPVAAMKPVTQNAILAVLSVFFVLGILATGSRGGILLGAFAGLAIILTRIKRFGAGSVGVLAGMGALGAILFAIGTFTGSRLFGATISRFEADDDARLQVWPEVVRMIGDTMPLGSGIGSFVTYYRFDEPLAKVGPKFVNSAHNEYMEIAMEAGIPGLLVLIAGLAVIAWGAWRALRAAGGRQSGERRLQTMASVGIVVPLAHSTFDYPLRTTGLAVVFALLCGLILGGRGDSTRDHPEG